MKTENPPHGDLCLEGGSVQRIPVIILIMVGHLLSGNEKAGPRRYVIACRWTWAGGVPLYRASCGGSTGWTSRFWVQLGAYMDENWRTFDLGQSFVYESSRSPRFCWTVWAHIAF